MTTNGGHKYMTTNGEQSTISEKAVEQTEQPTTHLNQDMRLNRLHLKMANQFVC
jgi:hypothetical protein